MAFSAQKNWPLTTVILVGATAIALHLTQNTNAQALEANAILTSNSSASTPVAARASSTAAAATLASPIVSVAVVPVVSHLETTFSLPDSKSDPFDYEKTDVRVQFRRVGSANSNVDVPAFFDGGTTWRARHTPTASGKYEIVGITLNNRVLDVQPTPRSWQVAFPEAANAGFIKLDVRDKTRFAFGNGASYFPIGTNQAWRSNELPDIPVLFEKMRASGQNWSRVWMNSWDGKNLDWPRPAGAWGVLDLDVARRWDTIVAAAQNNGIAFQMTLQHHGQYSTTVNPNWNDNPYNVKNGGFLQTPDEFFTDAQAKALTRRKLRYAVARWGYSPSVLAWELFNEVQFTDAARNGKWESIAAWHREMAAFLRSQDVYRHLITTSSSDGTPPSVEASADFLQDHVYATDLVNYYRGQESLAGKASFSGEFGPASLQDAQGRGLHNGLWAGLMSAQSGAPQYWFWDLVEKHDFYHHFLAASQFIEASQLATRRDLKRVAPVFTTASQADLVFGPGAGWGMATQSDFTFENGETPATLAKFPAFLQGRSHRAMNPTPLTLRVTFAQPGRFVVTLNKVAKAGAHLVIGVDGKTSEHDFAPSSDNTTPSAPNNEIAVDVAAGAHVITLQNTGADWVDVAHFAFTNFAPSLGGLALCNRDFVAAWVYNRANLNADDSKEGAAASGKIALPVLEVGSYRAVWWDTRTAKPLQTLTLNVRGDTTKIALQTPPVSRDMALFISKK